MCQGYCDWRLEKATTAEPLSRRIANLLAEQPGRALPLDTIASKLEMSGRTMRRRLAEEGLTYHQLVDNFRRDYSLGMLSVGQTDIKQLTFILGFKDVGSFRRVFRQLTGTTVGSWLRQHQRRGASVDPRPTVEQLSLAARTPPANGTQIAASAMT